MKLHEGKGTANLKMQLCLICAYSINDPPFLHLQISGMKAEAIPLQKLTFDTVSNEAEDINSMDLGRGCEFLTIKQHSSQRL